MGRYDTFGPGGVGKDVLGRFLLHRLLRAEWGWDRCFEIKARGALVARHIPFFDRAEPIPLPPGVAPPRARLPADDPAVAETPTRECEVLPVSAGLPATLKEIDGRLIAEHGVDFAYVVMADDRTTAASNGRDGFIPPRVRCIAP